jgi:BirA family transcriptional regulator, biotin operon repressor / biotin---[acetyl-CoA-carboxylase] ligase
MILVHVSPQGSRAPDRYNADMNSSNSSFPLDAAWRIDRDRLMSLAARPVRDWPIEIVDETGSTNADLMAQLKEQPRNKTSASAPDSFSPRSTLKAADGTPFVRVAYLQTAGRGRRGRAWVAQPGNALLFSTACVLPRPLEGLAGLSLAVGTAVLDALNSLPLAASARLALKWPNDILLDDGKLAGILIETAWNTPRACAVVIGIGINLHGAAELAAELDEAQRRNALPAPGNTPASLSRAWPEANLTDTLAAVLNALDASLARFAADGFRPFRQQWLAAHAYAGREVVLLEQGVEVARGVAVGIDDNGQLQIDTPTGLRTATTGDVSLRLAEQRP